MTLATRQASVYTWFSTVIVPAVDPVFRTLWEDDPDRARGIPLLGPLPEVTQYIEDAAAGFTQRLPSIPGDWDFKHRPDETEYDDPWVTLPTVDAEFNDLDKGIPNFGDEDPDNAANWDVEPVIGGTPPVIYLRGTPKPNQIGLRQATWRQAWGRFGFDEVPAQILDGCPNAGTGTWLNSLLINTRENNETFSFILRAKMRRIDQLNLANEIHEEWQYLLEWDKALSTWSATLDPEVGIRETYNGPTVPPLA